MANEGRLDLVVFGATGFTGALAVKEVEKLALEKNLTWGISGRNETKLNSVLEKVGKDIGTIPDNAQPLFGKMHCLIAIIFSSRNITYNILVNKPL